MLHIVEQSPHLLLLSSAASATANVAAFIAAAYSF
jgi:hypothetical protein